MEHRHIAMLVVAVVGAAFVAAGLTRAATPRTGRQLAFASQEHGASVDGRGRYQLKLDEASGLLGP
jgi:hypothetical protein